MQFEIGIRFCFSDQVKIIGRSREENEEEEEEEELVKTQTFVDDSSIVNVD